SENYEREKDIALRTEDLKRYREINRALEKLEAGSFGFCEECGLKIDSARLAEIPEAPLCYACQKRKEQEAVRRARPLEEETLAAPFRATVAEARDNVAYDREDAWQDVSKYNKLPRVYDEDVAEGEAEDDENAGYVEETDGLSNRDNKKQLE
ncbi:MAG TPA: yteA family sporulation protein, partial [Firmicutes bacterium]|nr:yteA family sporulation protein [Bacillota bacterium]